MRVTKRSGRLDDLHVSNITKSLLWASGKKYERLVPEIELASKLSFFEGMATSFILDTLIKTARDMSSLKVMGADTIAKNLMLQRLYKQVNGGIVPKSIHEIIDRGINLGQYTTALRNDFSDEELSLLESKIKYTRDFNFTASGLEAVLQKYSIVVDGIPIELPQHTFMLIAMDIFRDYHVDRMSYILRMYEALSTFKITLPSPEMTALRTYSTDYASCVLLNMGDNLDSWNEATRAMVLHTAASAGIGIEIGNIASIGDLVKGGKITHGGKIPVLKDIDASIQKATQNGRRGSGTPFLNFFDPEIISVLSIKSPRTEVGKRINDLSYGIKVRELVYQRAKANQPISLFSTRTCPELYEVFHSGNDTEFAEAYSALERDCKYTEQIDAREFLKMFCMEAVENSAYYLINIDEINSNSPYVETIYQSNICVEEVSPTKPVSESRRDDPDIAICVLANCNQGKVPIEDLPGITDLLVRSQTHIMSRQQHPTGQAQAYVRDYLSIGIGFSNHAFWLADNNLRYGTPEALEKHDEWMEHFQFGLITASANLAIETRPAPRFFKYSKYALGIMPYDRYKQTVDELVPFKLRCDWDTLKTKVMSTGMANVALSMVPPAESSSVPSNQTSGLEPIKDLITYKETKAGINKQFAPDALRLADKYTFAYLSKDMTKNYIKHVAVTQKWLDKSISANRWYNPELNENSKISMRDMIGDLYFGKYYGVKTWYYTNTFVEDVEDQLEISKCSGGGCEV